jgi:hypothetical protein
MVALASMMALCACHRDGQTPAPAALGTQGTGPASPEVASDGDGQGDAKVAGTNFNATAQIRCSGYQGAAAGMCAAGVVRGTETGTYVDVTLPDGRTRTIFFNKDGSFLSFSTAEADGTAAMEINAQRDGDTTIATLGPERYEIPDAFVLGD